MILTVLDRSETHTHTVTPFISDTLHHHHLFSFFEAGHFQERKRSVSSDTCFTCRLHLRCERGQGWEVKGSWEGGRGWHSSIFTGKKSKHFGRRSCFYGWPVTLLLDMWPCVCVCVCVCVVFYPNQSLLLLLYCFCAVLSSSFSLLCVCVCVLH